MIKLGASELRTTTPTKEDLKKIKRNPIYIILENVKVILCGTTKTR